MDIKGSNPSEENDGCVVIGKNRRRGEVPPSADNGDPHSLLSREINYLGQSYYTFFHKEKNFVVA